MHEGNYLPITPDRISKDNIYSEKLESDTVTKRQTELLWETRTELMGSYLDLGTLTDLQLGQHLHQNHVVLMSQTNSLGH